MSDKNQPIKKRVQVLLPVPLYGVFDYGIADGQPVPEAGSFVRVPFGNRTMTGVVWQGSIQSDIEDSKIRNITGAYNFPPLNADNRHFIDWVADYTLFPAGTVLKMAMSVDDVFQGVGETSGYSYNGGEVPASVRLTAARQKVLAVMTSEPQMVSEIAREADVSPSVVSGLAELGIFEKKKIKPLHFAVPKTDLNSVELSAKQQEAAAELTCTIGAGFSVTVLNGVTGSGKTEVYFDAVAEALKQGKQALVLLPEIGLTGQWQERFRRHFGVEPALWHSGLSARVRRETWKAVLSGEIRVLAGARSALFLPFPELGAIVVDEEHDASYKQEDGVIYQARDMAVVRAKISEIPVILSSATPSLETMINVKNGRYRETVLENRFAEAAMPKVDLIDMRRFPPENKDELKSFISPVLLNEISQTLERGEQTLLFLNRRGYAPLVLCRKCGYRFQCPHCSAWLVEHRNGKRLTCHHCNYSVPVPEVCPVCGEADALVSCGPGVERISEEISMRFPDARTMVITSDLNASAMELAELMERIHNKDVDIIIGTQILAKGHHFPSLTLVGVIDADLGLAGGDLRAGERTYQMLHQVSGRAGRAEKPGYVLLQTYDPDNQVIQAMACGKTTEFLEAEAMSRELLRMPPFGRLASVIISSSKPEQAQQVAMLFGRYAPKGDGMRVLGPAPAPLALLRGKYRHRLLLQTARHVRIQDIIQDWLKRVPLPPSVRVQIDIDPYSFF